MTCPKSATTAPSGPATVPLVWMSFERFDATFASTLSISPTAALRRKRTLISPATQNRFPKIVNGDYLEGGLTAKLMTKDVVLYIDRVRELGVSSLNASQRSNCRSLARAESGWTRSRERSNISYRDFM